MGLETTHPAIEDLERRAKGRIPHFAWEYLASGTGDDRAMHNNRAALDRVQLLPRVMRGKVDPKVATEILGQRFDQPFGIAPIGFSGLIWPGAEAMLARLGAKANVPTCLSTVATQTPEFFGPKAEGRGWFQLYVPGDKDVLKDMLSRAKASGFETLVVTVDVPTGSRRERQKRAGVAVPPKLTARILSQIAMCPAWALGILKHGQPRFRTLEKYVDTSGNHDITHHIGHVLRTNPTWDWMEDFRAHWDGPIVLKGILTPEDAKLAVKHGADAIWVSNHGGRQLDAAPPTIAQLPKIRDAVGAEFPVFFDSGIRSGLDIARALALGADFVFAGRPLYFGLGAFGERGAAHALDILAEDLVNVMEQCGAASVQALREHAPTPDFGPFSN